MELPKQLTDEIWEYCRANNITDIDGFITRMTRDGFTVERYGFRPEVVAPVPPKIVETPIETPKVEEPTPEPVMEQPKEEVKKEPVVERDIYDEPKRIQGSLGSNLLD